MMQWVVLLAHTSRALSLSLCSGYHLYEDLHTLPISSHRVKVNLAVLDLPKCVNDCVHGV